MSKTTLKINSPKNWLLGAITFSILATLFQVFLLIYSVFKAAKTPAPVADPVSQQLQTIRKAYDTLSRETLN